MKPQREQVILTAGVFAAAVRVLKSNTLQLPADHVRQLLNELDRAVLHPFQPEELSPEENQDRTVVGEN